MNAEQIAQRMSIAGKYRLLNPYRPAYYALCIGALGMAGMAVVVML